MKMNKNNKYKFLMFTETLGGGAIFSDDYIPLSLYAYKILD